MTEANGTMAEMLISFFFINDKFILILVNMIRDF